MAGIEDTLLNQCNKNFDVLVYRTEIFRKAKAEFNEANSRLKKHRHELELLKTAHDDAVFRGIGKFQIPMLETRMENLMVEVKQTKLELLPKLIAVREAYEVLLDVNNAFWRANDKVMMKYKDKRLLK
jgi:hypothetical protein